MTRLVRQRFEGVALDTTVTPGFSGRNDAPLYHVSKVYLGAPFFSRISTTRPPISDEFEFSLAFEDYVDGFNRIEFRLDDLATGGIEAETLETLPLEVYSLRMYFKMEAGQIVNSGFPNIVGFADGADNWTWSYKMSSFQWQGIGYPTRNHKPCFFDGAGKQCIGDGNINVWPSGFISTNGNNAPAFGPQSAQDAYQFNQSPWRLELQVDQARSPKVVARIYPPDSTTRNANLSITASPADVSMDRIYIGDDNLSGFTQKMYVSHIELHDDYDLGGQFTDSQSDPTLTMPTSPTAASVNAVGTPYRRPVYEVFELDRDTEELVPVEIAGTVDRVGEDINVEGAIDDLDYRYEVPVDRIEHHWWKRYGGDEEFDSSLDYFGDNSRRVGLLYPDPEVFPPPPNGYPIALWTHGGFWIAGSYRDLDEGWAIHWLNRGYAVATVGYIKSYLEVLIGTYDVTKGQYPTWLLDYKSCATWLRIHGRSEGNDDYPIDTTRMIFCGFSAGGYLALGAMASRELANDGPGTARDLRARTNTWARQSTTLLDPEPMACIVYGAPTDLVIAVNNDPTEGGWGSIMKATAKAFTGNVQSATYSDSMVLNTSIANMIERNAANIKPILYVQGGSDSLVVPEHEEALADAMATYCPDVLYRKKVTDVVHDRLPDMFNFNHVVEFLNDLP